MTPEERLRWLRAQGLAITVRELRLRPPRYIIVTAMGAGEECWASDGETIEFDGNRFEATRILNARFIDTEGQAIAPKALARQLGSELLWEGVS